MQALTADEIFGHSSYKLQIRDIFAIYNHEWDVIGEMVQNAVDSVMKRRETIEDPNFTPKIEILYDLTKKTIQVWDNGLGMQPDLVIKAVAPHFSGKQPSGTNRGEFGVGLAFVVFSSEEFSLESCCENKKSIIKVTNGYTWATNEENDVPLNALYETGDEQQSTYSKFSVKPIRFPLLSLDKLVFVLQRYTAIGDFWAAYNDNNGPIAITLIYVNEEGVRSQVTVTNRLWHPADHLNKLDRETVDYSTLKEIEDSPRNRAIPNHMGNGMIRKGKMVKDGKEFAYYALMCYSHIYKELKEAIGLVVTIDWDDENDEENTNDDFIVMPEVDLYPGIFACKKGMPLGADIPRPPRSGSGSWAAFYIVIHSDNLRTEPGRKKLNIEDERLVQRIAKSVHDDMDKLSTYVISRVNPDTRQEAILRAIVENQRIMSDWKITNPLHIGKLHVAVEPSNEQTLIALFHELIGAGFLKGYKVLKLSASDTYDGLYDYSIDKDSVGNRAFDEWLTTLPNARQKRDAIQAKRIDDPLIVVEFKLKLDSIISDFLTRSKYHSNIKLLIAWDADEASIRRRGWFLDKRPASEVRYFGANYILRPSSEGQSKGIQSTHVLLIKRFIAEIQPNIT